MKNHDFPYSEGLMTESRNNLRVSITSKIEDWHRPSNDQTQALGEKNKINLTLSTRKTNAAKDKC